MHPFLLFHFLILLVGDVNGVINKCIHKERHALLHFKASLVEYHDSLSTWRGDDCCEWNGVICNNRTGHITELQLYEYFNGGTINPSLLNLTYLNHLDLSRNNFSGNIPSFIGSMTRLRWISLSWNFFNGTIPSFFGSMTELRCLNLDWNAFHGIVPPELGNLTNLQELSLQTIVRCSVENISWLSNLSQLQSLDMSGISLSKANHWVNVVLSLQKLSDLHLEDCDLSQVLYPYSSSFFNSSFSSVATLDLSRNNLNSSMFSWLFALTSNRLEKLDLSSNMLDGIPKYLGDLCSLLSLIVKNNSAIVKFPDFLKNLSSGCTSIKLQELDVSNGQFTGHMSDDIHKFSSLVTLDLSHNQLNGSISDKLWELPMLETLYVPSNSFEGAISQTIGKSNILRIDLSNNSLEGVIFTTHKSASFHVEHIDLSSCKLGPRFPKWIQTLKNLSHLDIANARILDTIPVAFWNMWPSQLMYLNLSSNNISGKVRDLSSNFDLYGSSIDLSSNNFYGPILSVPSTLISLNLSRNQFNGGISFLCQIVGELLSFLDLSHNSFTGKLPDCLWHFNYLNILNLGNNKLSGSLPPSLGYLVQLEVLFLYNNGFSGELPLSLQNCTNLNILNLAANKFSGNVPIWIGENLSRLYALSLRSNNFLGAIPLQLCRVVRLQILDLSMNNLIGTIPTCLNNLTLMVQEGLSQEQNVHRYSGITDATIFDVEYADHEMIGWHGNEYEFTSTLKYLKSIDLSHNKLTGQIPKEITDLHELLALNLSNNALIGEIPQNIGMMKKLEVLDVSRNKISGGLPSSMSKMPILDYLDVSYNNLSGRIPSSTQLQSFEPSRYTGNAGLCGPPITKYCLRDPIVRENDGRGEGIDELQRLFYIGGATGFVIGFLIACRFLLLNHRGRRPLVHFLRLGF